jgi:hypothetical protein
VLGALALGAIGSCELPEPQPPSIGAVPDGGRATLIAPDRNRPDAAGTARAPSLGSGADAGLATVVPGITR